MSTEIQEVDEEPWAERSLEDILQGRRVRLVPLDARHLEVVYRWASLGAIPWQWGGRALGFDGFREALWQGILAHFMVERISTGEPLGIVTAYGANLHHQHCYIQMGLAPQHRAKAWPLEAGMLFLSYLFGRYNFRKIYGEVAGGARTQFDSALGAMMRIEGNLEDHVFIDGSFRSVLIVSIRRDDWTIHAERLHRHLSMPTQA